MLGKVGSVCRHILTSLSQPLAPAPLDEAPAGDGEAAAGLAAPVRRWLGLVLSPRKVRSGCGMPSAGKAAAVLRMYSCSLCLRSRLVESLGWPRPYVLETGNGL